MSHSFSIMTLIFEIETILLIQIFGLCYNIFLMQRTKTILLISDFDNLFWSHYYWLFKPFSNVLHSPLKIMCVHLPNQSDLISPLQHLITLFAKMTSSFIMKLISAYLIINCLATFLYTLIFIHCNKHLNNAWLCLIR